MLRRERDLRMNSQRAPAIPLRLRLPRIPARLRICAVIASYAVAFAAVGVLLAATLPSFAGFHTVTVYGGSMGKSLPAGSVAVTRPVDAGQLAIGDVIAIGGHEGGLPILHRIVAIEEVDGGRLVTTRGDANETDDRLPITVSGKGDRLVYHIPWIGYFLAFSRSQLGLALLVGIPAVVWAVSEFLTAKRAIKRRIERRKVGGRSPAAVDGGERGAVLAGRPDEASSNATPAASPLDPGVAHVRYMFISAQVRGAAPSSGDAPAAAPVGPIFLTFIGLAAWSASAPDISTA